MTRTLLPLALAAGVLVACAPAAPTAPKGPAAPGTSASAKPRAGADLPTSTPPAALQGIDMKYVPVVPGTIYTYDLTRRKPGGTTDAPRGTQLQTVASAEARGDVLRWTTTLRTSFVDGAAQEATEAVQEWRTDGVYLVKPAGPALRLLPAAPKVGDRWSNARFDHEVLALDGKAETPAGSYAGCLVVRSTVKGDGAVDESTYAPDVGYVAGTYTAADGTRDTHVLARVTPPAP